MHACDVTHLRAIRRACPTFAALGTTYVASETCVYEKRPTNKTYFYLSKIEIGLFCRFLFIHTGLASHMSTSNPMRDMTHSHV